MPANTDMNRYSKMMQRQFPKQFAFATADTLNAVAYKSKQNFRNKVADQVFDTKTKYVKNVVDDQRTQSRDVDYMYSAFGELEKKFGKKTQTQLGTHDQGGLIKPLKGRKRHADGTKAARGGSFRNAVRKSFNTAKRVGVDKITSPNTQRGRSIGLIAWAKRTSFKGLLVMVSPVKKVYGEFKVMGSKKNLKLRMVKNLESTTRITKAKHWMEKSFAEPLNEMQDIYNGNMSKQVDYLKKSNNL